MLREAKTHLSLRRRRAFTLVELLVVITIIGILAALLVPVVANALAAGNEARIGAEITQIVTAIEDVKNTVGAYPPNTQTGGQLNNQVVESDFVRYFNKAFPSHRESPQLLQALVGRSNVSLGSAVNAGNATNLVGGMTAAESLVFWLSGFSDDPKYPISGPNGPSYVDPEPTSRETGTVMPTDPSRTSAIADPVDERNFLLSIDVARLGPRTTVGDNGFDGSEAAGERYLRYADPRNPNVIRRINFWRYAAAGAIMPYVYFDASRASTITAANDAPAASPAIRNNSPLIEDPLFRALERVYPVKRLNPGNNTTPIFDRLVYANDKKFQILSAGLDNAWGNLPRINPAASDAETSLGVVLIDANDNALPLVFPEGPWPEELSDTLSNFTNGGRLEDAQP